MATTNGLFNIKLEMDASGNPKPFTVDQNFTASGDYYYSTATWDIAVHEVTWTINPTFIENADELRGLTSMPYHDGAGSMAAEITAKARVRPKMLGVLLYLATGGTVGSATGTTTDHAGTATGTSAYQHTFTWSDSNTPRTATIHFAPTKAPISGSDYGAWKCSGAALSTLAFSFEESGAMVADMIFRGLYFATTAASITPDYETDVPLKKGQFSFDSTEGDGVFTSDDTSSKAIDFNFSIENNVSNYYSFGSSTSGTSAVWPDAIEYEDLWARVSGSVTKRQVLASDYTRWITKGADATSGAFVECFQGVGDYLSGTSGPRFRFYMHLPAAQFMAMNPEAITNKRRVGVSFDWEARTDPDAVSGSKWADFYVVNLQNPTAYTAHS